MKKILLSDGWKLHEAPLYYNNERLQSVLAMKDGWMDCKVPCDVHTPLEEYGIIKDVVKADYCHEAEWVANRSWWYVKTFDRSEIDADADVVELVFDSLDTHADVFINGVLVKTQVSSNYALVVNIRQHLVDGENQVAVRLTTGMEEVNDNMLDNIRWAVCTERMGRGDKRRAYVRRPQYTVGWDWGPKAITVGIVKDAYIRSFKTTAVRGVHVFTEKIERNGASYDENVRAKVKVELEVENLDVASTRDADITVTIAPEACKGKANCEKRVVLKKQDELLTSGLNYIEFEVEIEDAELWWPNGYGRQPLYTLDVSVLCEGNTEEYPTTVFGIRTTELDLARIDDTRRHFAMVINGVHVYCKGGDWIPADSIYARVTDHKYEVLVSEAAQANFNMLRIWGGGIYERDVFYEYCDRYGIMIWHDFMLACGTYPDDEQWFNDEFDREVEYQTKRLCNHPSMCIWCGSNEEHMMFNPKDGVYWDMIDAVTYEKQLGLRVENINAKIGVKHNCPEIPYWNSSPYGGENPNDETVGDVHYWFPGMMNSDINQRIEPRVYDRVLSPFVSEYGYPGAYHYDSIVDTFGTADIDRTSDLWQLHNNAFEIDTVNAGIMKHYGKDGSKMEMHEYILYSGLTQSLMLGYSLEAMRYKDFCDGGMFWMYNDTWCEVGWTIIDYYLRRKNSFYGVRRAFAPVKLTMRDDSAEFGGKGTNIIKLQGCNDTDRDICLKDARIGYASFDGTIDETITVSLTLPARSRNYVYELELPDRDYTKGTIFVFPGEAVVLNAAGEPDGAFDELANCEIAPCVLRMMDMSKLTLPGKRFKVESSCINGNNVEFVLSSETYVHSAYLPDDYKCSDNFFDLVPGQVKKVIVFDAAPQTDANGNTTGKKPEDFEWSFIL